MSLLPPLPVAGRARGHRFWMASHLRSPKAGTALSWHESPPEKSESASRVKITEWPCLSRTGSTACLRSGRSHPSEIGLKRSGAEKALRHLRPRRHRMRASAGIRKPFRGASTARLGVCCWPRTRAKAKIPLRCGFGSQNACKRRSVVWQRDRLAQDHNSTAAYAVDGIQGRLVRQHPGVLVQIAKIGLRHS